MDGKKTAHLIKLFISMIVCAIIAELIYSGWFSDVSYLIPMHECTKRIERFRDGEDIRCPLDRENGYALLSRLEENNTGRIEVLCADSSLCHARSISLFAGTERFAMVLLSDGKVVEWIGREKDYKDALRSARTNAHGRELGEFFQKSRIKPRNIYSTTILSRTPYGQNTPTTQNP